MSAADRPQSPGGPPGQSTAPPTDQSPGEASRALIEHIERVSEERCTEIVADAETAAAEQLDEARREARRRVSEAVTQARSESESAVRAERARAQSRLRQRQHAALDELLERAHEALERSLTERWEDPDRRGIWLTNALALATVRLPEGDWRVEYPSSIEAGEVEDAARRGAPEARVEPVPDEELSAGARIVSGGAVLDATPTGLLARGEHIQGLLLGALQVDAGESLTEAQDED